MNFLKRAVMAVTRKKGKSMILFVIFAVVANLVLAGFAIQKATDYAIVSARKSLGGQLTLSFDMQRAMEKARSEEGEGIRIRVSPEPITEEMAEELVNHGNIIAYNYIVNSSGMADGFTPVIPEQEEQDENQNSNGGRLPQGFPGGNSSISIPDVAVVGVVESELLDAFNSGGDKLIEGRHIALEDADGKTAMIEKNLAEENGLTVGDTIKIAPQEEEESVEFTIVGIYETSWAASNQGSRMGNFAFTQPYNRIYVDYKSSSLLQTESSALVGNGGGISSAIFFIDDPKNIEKVKQDAQSMNIDWEKFTLGANDSAYKQMIGPIENVASFSMMVVYIVAIAGAVILSLILILSIKERMYETGVLLSMGEGKIKIIGQYLGEVMIIALLVFSLSSFTGGFIAQGISDTLITREINLAAEQGVNTGARGIFEGGFGQGQDGQFRRILEGRFQTAANGKIEPIDSVKIDVTSLEVLQMAMLGLLIIIAGTIFPAATVMRFKPKTILTKAI